MSGVKLKRLRIDRYRNVAPGTELVFNDTFNVLLGQNGTGKTTLLNLIAMVVTSDFASLKETEFALHYELSYPGVSATVDVANQRRADPVELLHRGANNSVNLAGLRGESFSWSYSVELRRDGQSDHYKISASPLGAKQEISNIPDATTEIPTVPPFDEFFFPDALVGFLSSISREHAEQIGANTISRWSVNRRNCSRFDEALGGFNAMSGAAEQGSGKRLGPSHLSAKKKYGNSNFERIRGLFLPGLLSVKLLSHPETVASAPDSIELAHEEIDFLKKAVELFDFKGAEMILRLLKKEAVDDGELLTYSNFSFLFALDQGSIFTQEALSYGQKRLLSFLYYVAANDDIIIADELVNGMHYAWIEACLDAIGDRQSFLTSQSPLLLDFLPFTSAEEVQRSFILSSLAKREHKRQLVWKNMSEQDAQSFFRAYKTQALQVSEILRSSGLW